VPVSGLENKEGKFIEKNINNMFLVFTSLRDNQILFFDGLQLWCRAPIGGGNVIALNGSPF